MYPTVVCFYTPNTGYEKQIKGLLASCKRFNIDASVDAIPHFGTWEKNCCFKPSYLLKKLRALKAPLLWLDADALIAQKPLLFEELKADAAMRICHHLPDDHPSKVISGTLFFNYTSAALTLLEEWEEETHQLFKKDPQLWDQISLRNVVLKSSAKIVALDQRYYQIFDQFEEESELKEAFFLHFQASRTLKKTLNGEVVPFWDEGAWIANQKMR